MVTGADLTAWMRKRAGKIAYSNDRPAKLRPDQSGKSDCSGMIWRDYKDNGVDIGADMSYDQAAVGREVASGKTVADFNAVRGSLQAGDILAMSIKDGVRGGTHFNHVELIDDDPAYSWGHGGYPPLGPNRHDPAVAWLLGNSAFWTVRRVLPTETKPAPTPTPAPASKPAAGTTTTPNTEDEMRVIVLSDNASQYFMSGDGTIIPLRSIPEAQVANRLVNRQSLTSEQFKIAQDFAARFKAARK